MKVTVDRTQCEANAVCMLVCPAVFKVDEEDVLHILIEEPGEEHLPKVREAVRRCPKQALKLLEE